jgi:hypothetical protein
MVRLGCHCLLLRRSFDRGLKGGSVADHLRQIRGSISDAHHRLDREVRRDRGALRRALRLRLMRCEC